jgi:hypothetical protein
VHSAVKINEKEHAMSNLAPPTGKPVSVALPGRGQTWRYFEVTDGDRFRGIIVEPMSVRDADRAALADASAAWGIPAADLDVFVVRNITKEKAKKLIASMNDGSFDPDWWTAR